MPFFKPLLDVDNYPEMLTRIAWWFAINTFIATIFLRHEPKFNNWLTQLEQSIPQSVGKELALVSEWNLGGAVIAIGLALIARFFHLHDKISNVIGIRKAFDLQAIIRPLAI